MTKSSLTALCIDHKSNAFSGYFRNQAKRTIDNDAAAQAANSL